jgi:hypothetical protein
MNDIFYGIFNWIKDDYRTHPFRFVVELLAWGLSIGCSIAMALTVPNPWAAFTRKSFGMLANYLLLVTIDSVGLIRMMT